MPTPDPEFDGPFSDADAASPEDGSAVPDGLSWTHEDDPADHVANRWVGHEFLLWLWWKTERGLSAIELPHYGRVELWFDDRILFRGRGEKGQTLDFKGGAPSTTLEARTALSEGRLIEEASIGGRVNEREYSFSLKASTFDLRGVKLPELMKEGGDEVLLERVFLLEEITHVVELLIKQYASVRLSPDWDSNLRAIRRWIHHDEL